VGACAGAAAPCFAAIERSLPQPLLQDAPPEGCCRGR
jgi:hypothetical protein